MLKSKAHAESGRDPFGPGDGIWTGPGSDPGEGLDGTPRDSNRLLGLSDKRRGFKRGGFPIWTCPSFFVLFGTFPIFPAFSRFVLRWSFSCFAAY